MSIQVISRFKTRKEKRHAFVDVLRSVKRNLPTIEGCKDVQVFCGDECSDTFTLVETWANESAHQAHVGNVIASGGWAYLRSHLAAEPERAYFRELA